jgi:predicted acetyltransferase
MNINLRKLEPGDEQAFKTALTAFQNTNFQFARPLEQSQSFESYLQFLADLEDPRKIPADRVPSTFMCAFLGDEIVGRVSIRHGLSAYIKEVGGHIGFGVVPKFRGQGVAKEILSQSLDFCRRHGLLEVLLTCDDDNIPSRRTIEALGGIFERYCADVNDGVKKRRYWIKIKD